MTDIHIPSCYPAQTLQIAYVWGRDSEADISCLEFKSENAIHSICIRECFYSKLKVQQKHLHA